MQHNQTPLVSPNKKRAFNRALTALRKMGYTARQNAACCFHHAILAGDLPSTNLVITTGCSLFNLKRTAIMDIYYAGPMQHIRNVFENHGLRVDVSSAPYDDKMQIDLRAVSDWPMEYTENWRIYQAEDFDMDSASVPRLISIDGIMRYTDQTTPVLFMQDQVLVARLYRDGDDFVEHEFNIKDPSVWIKIIDWLAVRRVVVPKGLTPELVAYLKEAA